MIHNLFPTPVGFYHLDGGLTADELSFIRELEKRPNMGNLTSEYNYLFDHEAVKRIADFANESLQAYFQEVYAPKHEVKPRITQSWANYTDKGQWHHKHEHPNSFISGVFYVASDPKLDKIYFYKNGYQQIKVTTEKWNVWNSESWWFEAEPNKLILFPSHLTHMVETVEAENTRISISFNTFLEGTIGDNKQLTELVL